MSATGIPPVLMVRNRSVAGQFELLRVQGKSLLHAAKSADLQVIDFLTALAGSLGCNPTFISAGPVRLPKAN